MTIADQFKIIKAYNEGTPVYYIRKYSINKYDWKKISADHNFNFETNVYNIGEPLTFEEALCESNPNMAFHQAMEHLISTSTGYGTHVKDTNERGKIIREYTVADLSSLYKLWNLAMNYGRNYTGELTPITEEEGKINNY